MLKADCTIVDVLVTVLMLVVVMVVVVVFVAPPTAMNRLAEIRIPAMTIADAMIR
jgi:hypothetical protein